MSKCEHGNTRDKCEACDTLREIEGLKELVERLQQKNTALHRRCQEAEAELHAAEKAPRAMGVERTGEANGKEQQDVNEIDCDFTDEIVCPHCGEKHHPEDYCHLMDSSNSFEWTCQNPECEREFMVSAHYSVSFSSQQKIKVGWVMSNTKDYEPSCEITKTEFDALCNDQKVKWILGPRIEGSDVGGYRDVMYMPNKRADGIIEGGRYVWCWAVGANVKRKAGGAA